MSLWNETTVAGATGATTSGRWKAQRVEIDSRRILPGDLFVAIVGERVDGHDYIEGAMKSGAVAALVSQPVSAPHALVADTLEAMADMGRFARACSEAKIVGVTGSVGKTSTKEMLRLGLAAHGETFATTGNFNNHIGTPLNLANLPTSAQFAVFEMGMNHANEIAPLTKMVRPHVAVITNVEAVHLEFFANEEAIADAKAEILEGVEQGGAAVLNADNRHFAQLKAAAQKRGITRIIACGSAPDADCRLIAYAPTRSGCEIVASIAGKEIRYTLGAIGRHWAITSLLTLAAVHAIGLDIAKSARALAAFCEPEGRGKLSSLGGITLIDDSYNASPVAMRGAFAKLAEVWDAGGKQGRKIAALGNMLELGEDGPALHAALAEDLQKNSIDLVFTCGNLMQSLHDALPEQMRVAHAAHAADLAAPLSAALRPGDILLIKGSHGSKIYELAAQLKQDLGEKNAL